MYILPALLFTLIFATCNKPPAPAADDFYFKCKLNGQTYMPNNCSNCLSFKVLEDTSLIANANRGFETIRFGINDPTNIQAKNYSLINVGGMRVTYSNSTLTNDYYRTQNFNPGKLIITEFDRMNKTMRGTFNFIAYHSFRANDSVIVSDGSFYIRYTTN
jgi:hypothetical protein